MKLSSLARSWLTLAILVRLSLQMDILNKGILFPCSTVLSATNRYYLLYGLELEADLDKTFIVPGSSTQVRVLINFCKKVNQSTVDTDKQTHGSPLLILGKDEPAYALSYFDGYLNSTTWTVVSDSFEMSPNISVPVLKISGANKWEGDSTKLVDSNFTILCDENVMTSNQFVESFSLLSFNLSKKHIEFTARSKYACGHVIPVSLNIPRVITVWIAGLIGFTLTCFGFRVLRTTLVVAMFIIGLCIGVSEVLENSSVLHWSWVSYTIYAIIIISMGFVLSYSAFFLPTGAIYLLALYIGHALATLICDNYDIKSRLYLGYLLIHVILLVASLIIFRNNLNNCKFAFTAVIGSIMMMIAYSNYKYPDRGLSFTDFIQLDSLQAASKTYLGTFFLAVIISVIGFKVQKDQHSRAGDEGIENGVDELLNQQ